MKRTLYTILMLLALVVTVSSCRTSSGTVKSSADAKHEFRGAWIQTAFQDRYSNMTPQRCREYLQSLIVTLEETGFNAVVFQVRPEGDAFYPSPLEPWSRFLTGTQGKAPSPQWDPMQYLIELCHNHGMEFHAWINPYRSAASKNWKLASSNIYYQHPEWFVTFDGRLYLNPGMPESRSWIRQVVKDIVKRYDVDAIHMDDYFYPYPVAGQTFDDHYTFVTYGPVMGYDVTKAEDLAAFRRRSVNILIKSVHEDIQALKPWVRFGISPFGIYRNKKSWDKGSNTNGTQCYDDLYADVLLWAEEGWIDYVIPQVYWEIGHKAADYQTLCDWWASAIPSRCQLYIGQSIERSLDKTSDGKTIDNLNRSSQHFAKKLNQARGNRRIDGNCFWYAYQVEDNAFGVRDYLRQQVFPSRALTPAYKNPSGKAPGKVKDLDGQLVRRETGEIGVHLMWTAPDTDAQQHLKAHHYNIYRFAKGESVNVSSTRHLYAHSATTEYFDFGLTGATSYTYVVVPVDYFNNEGRPVKRKFKFK